MGRGNGLFWSRRHGELLMSITPCRGQHSQRFRSLGHAPVAPAARVAVTGVPRPQPGHSTPGLHIRVSPGPQQPPPHRTLASVPSMASSSVSSLATMTAKHLGPGSVCPPLADGLLRCYSMKYCPYAQRAHLVLYAKKVKHDIVWVNLKNKPSWLFEKNPLGKVPILEQNGRLMFESLAVCDYLDEIYPSPPLYPSDPWKKAEERMFVELFSKVSGPMFKMLFNMGNREVQEKSCEDMKLGLDVFEVELAKRNTKYFGGNTPGMLDYMIWPWAERLELIQMAMGEDTVLPPQRLPKMIQWKKDMLADDPVAATYLPPETHAKFFQTFGEADPYDLKAKV